MEERDVRAVSDAFEASVMHRHEKLRPLMDMANNEILRDRLRSIKDNRTAAGIEEIYVRLLTQERNNRPLQSGNAYHKLLDIVKRKILRRIPELILAVVESKSSENTAAGINLGKIIF